MTIETDNAVSDAVDINTETENVSLETSQVETPQQDTVDSTEQEGVPEHQGEQESQSEQPEWFMKDKYKSVEEQARAAFELQKKMGKFWGSPKDDYQLDAIEGIDKDDPLVANLIPSLKELGLSQDGVQHLVKGYMDANQKMMRQLEEGLKKELTQDDAHSYHAIDKWMTDHLTPEERVLVKNNWLMSAEDFKLFNHLRLMAAPSTNVPNSNQSAVHFESSKEVENDKIKYRKELKEGVRVPDKNYENELAGRFRDARARELRNNK